MSVAIVAASLVVMRPCFSAIHRMLFPSQHPHSILYGHDGTGNQSSMASKAAREKKMGITKTVEIEMGSQSISQEDILRSRDRF
jgi:hypothetical protein